MSETINLTAYASLLKAASVNRLFQPKAADETDQVFLHRLADVISNLPDEAWDGLSVSAKKWFNFCCREDDEEFKEVLEKPEGYPEPAVRRRREAPVETAPALTVYETLVKLAKKTNPEFAEKHSREPDQTFLIRLLQNLPEEDSSLPSISSWVSRADLALDQQRVIPLPEGYPYGEKPKAQAPVIDESVQTKPVEHANGAAEPKKLTEFEAYLEKLAAGEVKSKRKKKAVVEKAPKAAKPPKQARVKKEKPVKVAAAKTGRKVKADSVTALIRDAINEHQDISVEELQNLLTTHGKGSTLQTITTTRASHLSSIRSLMRAGWHPPQAAA